MTEQTWSIKDLLYGFRGNFACGMQRVVPSRQDGSILPAWVANHSARLPAHWASHIIRGKLNWSCRPSFNTSTVILDSHFREAGMVQWWEHKWVEFVLLVLFSAAGWVCHDCFWFVLGIIWLQSDLSTIASYILQVHISFICCQFCIECVAQYSDGDIDGDNDDESQNYIELVHLIENCSY